MADEVRKKPTVRKWETEKKIGYEIFSNSDVMCEIVKFLCPWELKDLEKAIPCSHATYFTSYEFKIAPMMKYLHKRGVVEDIWKLPSNLVDFVRNVLSASPTSRELRKQEIVQTYRRHFHGVTNRTRTLIEAFKKEGIPYRYDSKLCSAWSLGTLILPLGQVIATMYLTHFLFKRGRRYFAVREKWCRDELLASVQKKDVDWMSAARKIVKRLRKDTYYHQHRAYFDQHSSDESSYNSGHD